LSNLQLYFLLLSFLLAIIFLFVFLILLLFVLLNFVFVCFPDFPLLFWRVLALHDQLSPPFDWASLRRPKWDSGEAVGG
jgi:hypothetical protein